MSVDSINSEIYELRQKRGIELLRRGWEVSGLTKKQFCREVIIRHESSWYKFVSGERPLSRVLLEFLERKYN
tara:strand:- start:166 stop:381 length:216 start_codon:yes stop_codon:yes gene_type:complete